MSKVEATIHLPAQLHSDTAGLVVKFAEALAEKLTKAQKEYGYTNGWKRDDWREACSEELLKHVQKGDPRDVAAYCAFMWHHNWRTSLSIAVTVHP